jgi:hypothetical protein
MSLFAVVVGRRVAAGRRSFVNDNRPDLTAFIPTYRSQPGLVNFTLASYKCRRGALGRAVQQGDEMDIQQIPVDQILLDQRNPRIAHATEPLSGTVSQEWITLALGHAAPEDEERGTSTTYSSLKASIRANKGIINPINVTRASGGGFVVIEGNTRVAIYRELAEEKAPKRRARDPAPITSGWAAAVATVREGQIPSRPLYQSKALDI